MERLDSTVASKVLGELYKTDAFNKEFYPWKMVEELPFKKPETMTGRVEIIGLPGSGKSKFLNYAKEVYKDKNVIIRDELVVRSSIGEIENWGHGEDSNKLKGLILIEFGRSHQMMIWNQIKLKSHFEGEVEQIKTGKKLIIERGCNDVFATIQLTQPEHYSTKYDYSYKNLFNEVALNSMYLASRVDAVILFGTNWETTMARRIASGQNAEGRYVNSKNWSTLVGGYEIWLGSFYPLFRRVNGMGLLVIDGTENLNDNNLKAIKFCEKVFGMKDR